MKAAEFNNLLNKLNGLTDDEQEKLTHVLQRVGGEEKVIKTIESRFKSQACCPLWFDQVSPSWTGK